MPMACKHTVNEGIPRVSSHWERQYMAMPTNYLAAPEMILDTATACVTGVLVVFPWVEDAPEDDVWGGWFSRRPRRNLGGGDHGLHQG